jgi:hypothetical protein
MSAALRAQGELLLHKHDDGQAGIRKKVASVCLARFGCVLNEGIRQECVCVLCVCVCVCVRAWIILH